MIDIIYDVCVWEMKYLWLNICEYEFMGKINGYFYFLCGIEIYFCGYYMCVLLCIVLNVYSMVFKCFFNIFIIK